MSENHEKKSLKRSIKSRHLTMIAVGGTIGTGIFFASGAAIGTVGPGGALFAFSLIAFIVYLMMRGLGEMATELPISGSFEAYANRFIDPALGFAFGWNYWFSWSITVAVELVAAGLLVNYLVPANGTLVAIISLALLMGLNLISARAFAESEYWFAGIKVIVVIAFLAVGILVIAGAFGSEVSGFSNWTLEADGQKAPFIGGIGALLGIFMITGFSFQGTELVGLAAAETENPSKNVPKAVKSVFWRMVIFYIGSILIIATIIPFNEPQLLNGSIEGGQEGIAASPFSIVFEMAGLDFAAKFMTFVILTSVLSCGNSGLFCASRMLYSMATRGSAPKFLSYVNKHGVPIWAVTATGLIAALSFFTSMVGDQKFYLLLLNASGTTGFIIWFGVALTHYRFRRAWIAQGNKVEDLQFRSKFYPFGPIFAMILFAIIIFGANYWVFEDFNWFDFLTAYSFVPVFLILYGGYKYKKKTKLIPLKECDLTMPEHEK